MCGRTLLSAAFVPAWANPLFSVMWLVPKSLRYHTNQTVSSGIRKKRPIQPKGKVEMDARKHDWAGVFH
jgi:hypothetical protein